MDRIKTGNCIIDGDMPDAWLNGTQWFPGADRSVAEQRRASDVDVIGHSGLQPWSQGEFFPAVIAVRERYDEFAGGLEWHEVCSPLYSVADYLADREAFYDQPLEARLRSRAFVLMLDGQECEYASMADAEEAARALVGSPFLRAQWQAGKGEM